MKKAAEAATMLRERGAGMNRNRLSDLAKRRPAIELLMISSEKTASVSRTDERAKGGFTSWRQQVEVDGGVDACHGAAVGVLPDGEVELRVRLGGVVLGEPDGTSAQIGVDVAPCRRCRRSSSRAALLETLAERPRTR
ncbi:MAG: hypothetical protein ACLTMP_05820 [Eggerthella lenta]